MDALSHSRRERWIDLALGLLVATCALALYVATLLPGIGSGDTAEFQRVVPSLGVPHPTGYPLYALVGWLWSQLPIGGTPAWRMNLFSALAAAAAVGALYACARTIGQARVIAAAAALALATSYTFWSQATIAEVYALAGLLLALVLLALLRWRAGGWPLWVAGLLFGLGLAHHRTIILIGPGALSFVLLARRRLRAGEIAAALAAALAGCLLYLYLPLRAPQWINSWPAFVQYVSGSDALSVWLTPEPPLRVAWAQLGDLVARFIWPQFFPAGALLALLGMIRLWRRDRALLVLLACSYGLDVLFCTLFFVQDVEVFLLPAHLLAALLIGEGAMWLAGLGKDTETRRHGDTETRKLDIFRSPGFPIFLSTLAGLTLLLPALLLARNLAPVRAANSTTNEQIVRAIMAQPLPAHALLIVDWEAVEGLRYLQAIEGQRADIEVLPLNTSVLQRDVNAALAAGRAAYLLRPQPTLALAQTPQGRLWRVSSAPPELVASTPADVHWHDGITLKGYSLASGPYQPGDIVPLTLDWRAEVQPQGRYTLFVHLVGADGMVWGQQDREPARAPTDQWRAGERTLDVYGPALSQQMPPGLYQVLIGWYSYPSLARLPLADPAADTRVLGAIEVVGRP